MNAEETGARYEERTTCRRERGDVGYSCETHTSATGLIAAAASLKATLHRATTNAESSGCHRVHRHAVLRQHRPHAEYVHFVGDQGDDHRTDAREDLHVHRAAKNARGVGPPSVASNPVTPT